MNHSVGCPVIKGGVVKIKFKIAEKNFREYGGKADSNNRKVKSPAGRKFKATPNKEFKMTRQKEIESEIETEFERWKIENEI